MLSSRLGPILRFSSPASLKARLQSTASGMGKLSGKVAIVTASTDGIGFAIAERLASDGAKVMISSRKGPNVEKALAELKSKNLNVTGMVCNAGNAEQCHQLIEETVKQHGGLDILVSNAAANPHFGNMFECSPEAWDKIFEVNVKGAFLLTKEVIPHMEKRGGGSVVYVASIAGYSPMPMLGPYSVSKTALIGLTKAASTELGPHKIRVNCIAPGVVKTRFSNAIVQSKELTDKVLEGVPLGRFAVPSEMAGTVSFLCSDDASYITGETIVISGGMQSRL